MKKKIIASILLFSVVALCSCDMSKTLETETTETTEVTEETEITEETTEATAKVMIVEPDIEPSESEIKIQAVENPYDIDVDKFTSPIIRDCIETHKDDTNVTMAPIYKDDLSEDEINDGIIEALYVRNNSTLSVDFYIQFDTVEHAQAYLEKVVDEMRELGIVEQDTKFETPELDSTYKIDELWVSVSSDAFMTLRTR